MDNQESYTKRLIRAYPKIAELTLFPYEHRPVFTETGLYQMFEQFLEEKGMFHKVSAIDRLAPRQGYVFERRNGFDNILQFVRMNLASPARLREELGVIADLDSFPGQSINNVGAIDPVLELSKVRDDKVDECIEIGLALMTNFGRNLDYFHEVVVRPDRGNVYKYTIGKEGLIEETATDLGELRAGGDELHEAVIFESGIGPYVERLMPEVRFVGFNLDKTLYPKNKILDEQIQSRIREALSNIHGKKGWELLQQRIEVLGDFPRALYSLDIDGKMFFNSLWNLLDLENYIDPDPVLSDIVHRLKREKEYTLIQISNGNGMDDVVRKDELLGIDPGIFDVIIATADDYRIRFEKPERIVFDEALSRLGARAEEAIFIGDNERADVMGAKGAGWWAGKVGKPSSFADINFLDIHDIGEFFRVC